MTDHKSDCAVHNAPAMKAGPCDCGAETAQVQDDARETAQKLMTEHLSSLQEAQKIVEGFVYGRLGDRYLAEDMAASTIADALREAEQRGMRRAAEIAGTYEDWCGNWGAIKNEIAARECSKEIADAIERAAEAPTTQGE